MPPERTDHFAYMRAPAEDPGPDTDKDTPAFSLEQVEYLDRMGFGQFQLNETSVPGTMDHVIQTVTNTSYASGQKSVVEHLRRLAMNPTRSRT